MRKSWKNHPGASHSVDADAAFDELERIRCENDGRLTPKAIVQESTPKEAVLHNEFEWRNGVAGNLWREHQARNIVKQIIVIDDKDKKETRPAYVHVHIPDSDDGKPARYYQSVTVAVTRPDEWLVAMRELNMYLSGVERVIDQMKRLAGNQQDEGQALKIALVSEAVRTIRDAVMH
ncbi:MAG: hypothetical protein KDJ31_19955 [Candidatus Competibacteraceae bacterium]|nr:hypothetical protein [Candidatus Competibacteraceae bacterium]